MRKTALSALVHCGDAFFCKNNNWLLLLPPRRIDCSCRLLLLFREASSKGGVFVGFRETYTFIYKVNPNKLKRATLARSPSVLDWRCGTRVGEYETSVRQ